MSKTHLSVWGLKRKKDNNQVIYKQDSKRTYSAKSLKKKATEDQSVNRKFLRSEKLICGSNLQCQCY